MSMHPEERGLLDDIIANPDDDAPRLIYADWLEEEGGRAERAALLRHAGPIPLANSSVGQINGGPGGWLTTPDSAQLPRHLVKAALAVVGNMPLALPSSVVIRRGFLERVNCPLAAWIGHGPALCDLHPVGACGMTDCAVTITDGGCFVRVGHIHFSIHYRYGAGGAEPIHGSVFDATRGLPAAIVDAAVKGFDAMGVMSANVTAAVNAACLAWAKAEAKRRREPKFERDTVGRMLTDGPPKMQAPPVAFGTF